MRNRTFTFTTAAVALLGVGCATGSDGNQPVEQPAEAKQEVQQAEPEAAPKAHQWKGKGGKRFGRHGKGREGHLFGAALHHLELTDEQRETIEGLRANLKKDREAGRTSHQARKAKLVAAVRAGNLDGLTVDEAEISRKAKDRAVKIAIAMNELHTTLDPEQRKALVDVVRAKHEHRAKRGEERRAKKGDKAGRGGKRFGLGRLLEGLELTDEQRAQVEAAQASRPTPEERAEKRKARAEQMEKLLSAFAQDDFDATRLNMAERLAERMTKGNERHTSRLQTVLPILTDEQRTQLADRMEKRFERMGPHHRGMKRHRSGNVDPGAIDTESVDDETGSDGLDL